MIIAMSVSDHTALKLKEIPLMYVLHNLHRHSKGIQFFIFNLKLIQGSLIVPISLVLNAIFLGLKSITIQYRVVQSATGVFQKYNFCEDYTNLFWRQIFWRQTSANFKHFLCQNFCDVLKQSCLYILKC